MANLIHQTVVLIADVPEWCEQNVGFKPTRSTVFRWRTKGARGRRLKTFPAGGRIGTTVEWLEDFFSGEEPTGGFDDRA